MYRDGLRDRTETSEHAEKVMHEAVLRPEFIEGITAFFQKRAPSFPPLRD